MTVQNEVNPHAATSSVGAWYAVAVLAVVNLFNFLDRMVLAVLMPPIKAELGLSDTQLGLLTGLAFALFYAGLGLPIARLADAWSRTKIIALSVACWSVMTALCGVAQNYVQLLLARIGVGVGEAGASPASSSLIGDYVPFESRPLAFALMTAGSAGGIMLGVVLGGVLSEHIGWRQTFFVLGAPGLLLAALVLITLREPVRGRFDAAEKEGSGTIADLLHFLLHQRSYLHLAFAMGIGALPAYGIGTWLPSYYSRTFGMTQGELGLGYGVIIGVGSILGTLLGGVLAARALRRGPIPAMWISIAGYVLYIILFVLMLLASSAEAALAINFVKVIVGGVIAPPLLALMISVVRPRMRAVSSAFYGFLASLLGLGLGPLAVGILSDAFAAAFGDNALKYALMTVSLVMLWPIVHIVLAMRDIDTDLARVKWEAVDR